MEKETKTAKEVTTNSHPIATLVFGIIFAGLLIYVSNNQKEEDAKSAINERQRVESEKAAAMEVTAEAFAAVYAENPVLANNVLKGKYIKVTGIVHDISIDLLGHPFVTLRNKADQFNKPQLTFADTETGKLAKIAKGAKVKLLCIGAGEVMKTPMAVSCTFE